MSSSDTAQHRSPKDLSTEIHDGPGQSVSVRLARRYAQALDDLDSRFGLVKLILAVLLLALVVGSYPRLGLPMGVGFAALALIIFFVLAAYHRRLRSRQQRWAALALSYQAQQVRKERHFAALMGADDPHVMTGDSRAHRPSGFLAPWSQEGVRRAVPPQHLFATDLDVTRLLFPLLDTCATPEASEKMAGLLLAQDQENGIPSALAAQQRSARIRAIAPYGRLLRELDATRFAPDVALSWSQGKASRLQDLEKLLAAEQMPKRIVGYLGFGFVSIVAWITLLLPAHLRLFRTGDTEPYFSSVLSYAIVPLAGLAVYRGVIECGNALRRRMASLEILMRDIGEIQDAPALSDLAQLVSRARADLRNLRVALDLLASRSNPVFWLFVHAILPFDTLLCLLSWLSIRRVAEKFAALTSGLVEFDCDAAFARFWRENPEFTFSEFVTPSPVSASPASGSSGSSGVVLARLEAEGMGHPLLPRNVRVANSVQWGPTEQLVLLTGSNMSGKSTFLRTIGINSILHNIGAPVCAERFRAPVVKLLCAIRVDDAIEAGTSYFYAEVKRLAALLRVLRSESSTSVQSGGDASVSLYLIDEIFRGTNNRERFLGSLYVIRGFLESSALGIVTTHDLSLTQLQKLETGTRVRNMHFRETVEAARLRFDYLLREGPCPTTNALRIMHLEGLPVPAEVSEAEEAALLKNTHSPAQVL